jgi:flagellar basal body rod protein FlgB
MSDVDLVEELLEMVERHAQRNAEDIKLARTRDEHIRVTARANEAREIADKIRVITESNN